MKPLILLQKIEIFVSCWRKKLIDRFSWTQIQFTFASGCEHANWHVELMALKSLFSSFEGFFCRRMCIFHLASAFCGKVTALALCHRRFFQHISFVESSKFHGRCSHGSLDRGSHTPWQSVSTKNAKIKCDLVSDSHLIFHTEKCLGIVH